MKILLCVLERLTSANSSTVLRNIAKIYLPQVGEKVNEFRLKRLVTYYLLAYNFKSICRTDVRVTFLKSLSKNPLDEYDFVSFFRKKLPTSFCFGMEKRSYLEKFSSYSLAFKICCVEPCSL